MASLGPQADLGAETDQCDYDVSGHIDRLLNTTQLWKILSRWSAVDA